MSKLSSLINKTLDKIYVDNCNCIVCNRELSNPNRYGLCNKCKETFARNEYKVCLKCGKPIKDESDYCMVCQNSIRYFDRASSPLIYKDSVEKLILNFKFYNKRYLAKYLASFLVDEYLNGSFNADVIVPVPCTRSVMSERSFNQTQLLANELSKRLNLPMDTELVLKIKETKHQASLGGKERQTNVEGAYKLIGDVKERRVLIIDDILTTGATMSEVARVIHRGKPQSVEGIALANAEYKPYME